MRGGARGKEELGKLLIILLFSDRIGNSFVLADGEHMGLLSHE